MLAAASSTTWSRTSTSSSTSEPAPPTGRRPRSRLAGPDLIAARLRLVHPFPSLLNGAATAVIAGLAGAGAPDALRLGLAMTTIQFSIGALNDLVDAPRDRGRRPPKPVAEGLIQPAVAGAVAALAGVTGLVLAAVSGWATLAIAAAGAAAGYAYDLRLSRTALAWLPLAVALPLVPLFAWVGTTGEAPGSLLVLVPIGMVAGGGLAIGNALADLDADRLAAAPSVAVRLGRRDATVLHAAMLAAAAALAAATVPAGASPRAWAVIAGGAVLIGVGIVAMGRAGAANGAAARLAWQVEALGTAGLGVGWLLALVDSGIVAN